MGHTLFVDNIIVSGVSIESKDSASIAQSNVDFVNALLRSLYQWREISPEALQSYYVSAYAKQMSKGGFADFIYRTGGDKFSITSLVAGMHATGSPRHVAMLAQLTEKLQSLSLEELGYLHDNAHPNNPEIRQLLNASQTDFLALNSQENLTSLNSYWLKHHPKLRVMTEAEITRQIQACAASVSDRSVRIARALLSEPLHMQLIRSLCDRANLDFLHVSGEKITKSALKESRSGHSIIWTIETVQGAYYMTQGHTEARMFETGSHDEVSFLKLGASSALENQIEANMRLEAA
jgi:hypothetical protein